MKKLTHIDDSGRARMVDVGAKEATERVARASGFITMGDATLEAIRANSLAKGDALGVARIAGIMAAKRTAELIPLCHQIALVDVAVDCEIQDSPAGVRVTATAKSVDRTGVEMEALTAVSVALLTIYDMAKGIDRGMTIAEVRLVGKRGGKSGDWSI